MTGLFALIGAGVGLGFGWYYRKVVRQRSAAARIQEEFERDLASMIAAREGERAEFKVSARWDAQLGKMNRALEDAVVRALAGFLNHEGGSDRTTIVGRLTLQLFLVPVFGLNLAMALFRETIGTLDAAGIAIVVLGIGVTVRDSPHEARSGAVTRRRP